MPATLKSRLLPIAASLPVRVGPALRAGGEAISAEAKARVPVETGELRDAIHVETVEDGISVVAGDDDAFYGHIVEHGSVHSPAHPFLVPAAEAQKDTVENLVTAVLRKL